MVHLGDGAEVNQVDLLRVPYQRGPLLDEHADAGVYPRGDWKSPRTSWEFRSPGFIHWHAHCILLFLPRRRGESHSFET